jgi:hypothetical protein
MSEKPIQKFIHAAREIMRSEGYFVENLWHVDDVHFLCEQRGWPQLRHEEAMGVFVVFNELFEGDQGLTWDKLEKATQIYLAQAGRLQQILQNEAEQMQRL